MFRKLFVFKGHSYGHVFTTGSDINPLKSSATSQKIRGATNIGWPTVQHMSVNHCRLPVSVTQKLLHCISIGALPKRTPDETTTGNTRGQIFAIGNWPSAEQSVANFR